ncbi:metal ABC transporter solute-binding protein, Zn/Mn family [Fusobacterium sp. MFO224]|uniref:metal ABC transporter solute-binding protein, Zn/Mn family n=1 Tax=Fusobacterium sp. MFO224 TaxID=3378070 RepID=UPI003853F3BA
MMRIFKKIGSIILMLLIFGCGQKENINQNLEKKMNVVVTTTMLGDLAREIGKDKINVNVLMNIGVSPHSYQPKLSDTQNILGADLIVVNGLYLEGKMEECLKNISKDKLLVIGDEIDKNKLILMESGEYDPHIFLSLNLWKDAANILEKRLSNKDKKNKIYYEKAKNSYIEKLNELDKYIKEQLNKIEPDKKILVTSHRAFNYFAKDYSFETNYVKGISSENEVSISTINKLVNYIKSKKIKTIFLENSTPENILDIIVQASEKNNWEINIGGKLYVGSLGDKKSGADTYIKYYKKNVDTIVKGLI